MTGGSRLGRARWRSYLKLAAGLLLIGATLVGAVGADVLAPYDPELQQLDARLLEPGSESHLLGTDSLGRDLLSRLIHGARVSLLVGFASVILAGSVGVPLGLLAGYYGGRLDGLIMRLVDLQLAIPFLVLALTIMAVVGQSLSNLIIVLGLSGWVAYARVVRGQVLVSKTKTFVEAAKALGLTQFRTIVRHLLPEVWPSVLVVSTLQVGQMIIAEASLSFLGLGAPPDVPTWGRIAAEGRDYLTSAWWITTSSGVAILLMVLGINLIGDWLRDHLDPTLKV